MNQSYTTYDYLDLRNAAVREGLRRFMLRVYGYMAFGLLITAAVAVTAYRLSVEGTFGDQIVLTDFGQMIYLSWLRWVILFAPLAMVIFISVRSMAMSSSTAQLTFWIFSGLMGLSLSSIFLIYDYQSSYQVGFVAAAMFGTMSFYGLVTRRDLSSWGGFLTMALFGLIISFIVNMFIGGETFSMVISAIGVIIFCGLTAYDTNRLKRTYSDMFIDGDAATKLAINGALSLYLSFINLFLLLLSLFGGRR